MKPNISWHLHPTWNQPHQISPVLFIGGKHTRFRRGRWDPVGGRFGDEPTFEVLNESKWIYIISEFSLFSCQFDVVGNHVGNYVGNQTHLNCSGEENSDPSFVES